jgi:hypothetical protein
MDRPGWQFRVSSTNLGDIGGSMGRRVNAAFLMAALAMVTPWVSAQEKPKSEDAPMETRQTETTPLKISLTVTELEGDKKVKSLPYTMIVVADGRPPKSVVKIGSRVPVYAGKEYGMQYVDVGTSIDCQASRTKDSKFDLRLILERSWVEGSVAVAVDPATAQQSSGQFPEPVLRKFKSELSLTLRDGQTIESSFATDPLSGRVFKVEVSLNLVK